MPIGNHWTILESHGPLGARNGPEVPLDSYWGPSGAFRDHLRTPGSIAVRYALGRVMAPKCSWQAWQAWPGLAWPGLATLIWTGLASPGLDWPGHACLGLGPGLAWPGLAWQPSSGLASPHLAWTGLAMPA